VRRESAALDRRRLPRSALARSRPDQQWNTNTRIDWSQDLDPENPQELPDESITIFGSDVDSSAELRNFRSRLFTRIVPTIRHIGLWGPKIRRAYSNMGILGFADVDTDAMWREDERVAQEFDARRRP
jgi:hypothetical protein